MTSKRIWQAIDAIGDIEQNAPYIVNGWFKRRRVRKQARRLLADLNRLAVEIGESK